MVGSITDEELLLYVSELLKNICFAHGPNAPIWFTSIGWNKLAAQPREIMQENCVKTPMLHITSQSSFMALHSFSLSFYLSHASVGVDVEATNIRAATANFSLPRTPV